MRRVLGALATGVSVFAIHQVQAQDASQAQPIEPSHQNPIQQLPTISVTGSQLTPPFETTLPEPKLLHQPTQSVSVIDRAQIEMSSPSGITDLLSQVPGVTISRSGGIGGQAFIRGMNTNDFRVPLFVNGVRFRGRNTLQFLYFPPEDIERIEVIRGPAAALYGSDALGGLINIVTKRAYGDPKGPIRFGGAGTAFTWGSNAGTLNEHGDYEVYGHGLAIRASFNHRHAGDYQNSSGQIPNSDFETLGGALALDYTPIDGHKFVLDLHSERDSDGTAGAPGAPYMRARNDDNRLDSARLGYFGDFTGLLRHVEANVYINQFYTGQDTVNNAVLRRTTFTTNNVIGPTVIGGRTVGDIPWMILGGEAKTTIGMDFSNEMRPGPLAGSQTTIFNTAGNVASTTYVNVKQSGPATQQAMLGVFAMQEWSPTPDWTLTGAVRYDNINTSANLAGSGLSASVLPVYLGHTSVTNSAITGNGGVVFRPTKQIELYGQVATSFRTPTTFDLYTSTVSSSGTLYANPSLQPERGLTFEAGYRVHTEKVSLNFAAFHNQFTSYIQTVQLGSGNTQKQNIGNVSIDGVEIEGRYGILPEVTIFGTLSTLYGTVTSTGRPLPYTPPLYGSVGAQYVPAGSGMYFVSRLDWAAAKTRIDPAMEYPTAGYAVLNLYASFNLSELLWRNLGDATLSLGLENVFNTYYQRGSTVPSMSYPESNTNPLSEPGRNFTVTLRKRF